MYRRIISKINYSRILPSQSSQSLNGARISSMMMRRSKQPRLQYCWCKRLGWSQRDCIVNSKWKGPEQKKSTALYRSKRACQVDHESFWLMLSAALTMQVASAYPTTLSDWCLASTATQWTHSVQVRFRNGKHSNRSHSTYSTFLTYHSTPILYPVNSFRARQLVIEPPWLASRSTFSIYRK